MPLNKLQRIASLLGEALGTKTLKVNGSVGVEMIDPRRNKVVSQQKSKNYINGTMINEWAKSVQKLVWTYGYQGDATTVTVNPYTNRDPRFMPTVRNDHICCWTDTTAETTADMFAFGEIVAWAHRWQQGSPSTRQGIVVPSLCTIGPTSVKWVWEWGTANGNGTFQSIGWRRISLATNSGDTRLADHVHLSRQVSSLAGYTSDPSTSLSGVINFSPGNQFNGGSSFYDSGSGKLYFITDTAMVSAVDVMTGQPVYQQVRLPKPYNIKASPVAVAGRLYFPTEEGDVIVAKIGPMFDILATNTLTDQSFIASPALADGDMYLRSRTHLFRISDKK